MRLSPFSFVILVLVGRGGAGPHDLRRMAEIGRVYWDAAPSQWYAEPKRLEAHGYLAAHKTPGRTRERTHYTLTERGREALAEWVRTPATLPRIQNEPVIRLAAADLVAVRDAARGQDEVTGAQRHRVAGQVQRDLAAEAVEALVLVAMHVQAGACRRPAPPGGRGRACRRSRAREW